MTYKIRYTKIMIYFTITMLLGSCMLSEASTTDQMILSAPSAVVEGSDFSISVSINGTPVSSALVYFGNLSVQTDEQGVATLTAPLVEEDTSLSLVVDHDLYATVQSSLSVYNQREQMDKGWIYGQIYQSSGKGIKSAHVCVVFSQGGSVSSCVFTDSNGMYDLLVPVGTYSVVVEKQGYESVQRDDVQVLKNEALEQNFVLVASSEKPEDVISGENRDLIEAAIDAGISADLVGGEIDVTTLDESYDITLYEDELSVDVVFVNESEVRFQVDAEGVSDTIIALRVADPGDVEKIEVLFDDEEIEQIDFVDIFQLGDSPSDARYAKVAIEDTQGRVLYCLVYVPEFSVHEITIRSLGTFMQGLGGLSAVLVYLASALTVVCILLLPVIVNIFRRRRLLK